MNKEIPISEISKYKGKYVMKTHTGWIEKGISPARVKILKVIPMNEPHFKGLLIKMKTDNDNGWSESVNFDPRYYDTFFSEV